MQELYGLRAHHAAVLSWTPIFYNLCASYSALAEAVKVLRSRIGMNIVVEQIPVGKHQANYAEGAVEKTRQRVGTILSELEARLKISVKTLDPLRAWCWRHVGRVLNQLNAMQNLTAWERLHEVPYSGKIIRFGECVLSRVNSKIRGKPRWLRSLWLGKSDAADTHFVCVDRGAAAAHR